MRVTERDIEMVRFINEFGFCDMSQIEKRFSISRPYGYEIMQRLVKQKFVKHERVFHGKPGIYTVTHKGAQYTDLPPLDKLYVGQYDHQLSIVNVYLQLRQQYPDAEWISERQLKHDKFRDGVGKKGHVSDGILQWVCGKRVAIEVELTRKGKNRLEKILKSYIAQFAFQEVWYYCAPHVIPALMILTEKMPFIKVYDLTEFLT
jgi:DNA-binding PadR family transcriptional regulator